MNAEDYIILNKKVLEKELENLKDIRNNEYTAEGCNYDKHYIDAKIYCIESIFSKSKPLTPLLEETFEAGRETVFDGSFKKLETLSDKTNYNYKCFEDFIKDKKI